MSETIQVSSEQFNAMLAGLNLLHQAMEYAGEEGLEEDDPGIFEIASNDSGEMLSLDEVQSLISGLNAGEFDYQDGPNDGFYIIYETDAWQSCGSESIKGITGDLESAVNAYWQVHRDYHTPTRFYPADASDGWQLRMARLPADHVFVYDSNVLRQAVDCTPQPQPE